MALVAGSGGGFVTGKKALYSEGGEAGKLSGEGGPGTAGNKKPQLGAKGGAATVWGAAPSVAITDNIPDFNFSGAAMVDTNPVDYSNGLAQGLADGTAYDQITSSGYDPTVGAAYLVDANDTGINQDTDYGFGAWVQSITDQLNYGETERINAAREEQVARGMGRSGQAILAEDAVRQETDLTIAQYQAEAAVEQARLEQDTMKAHAELKTQRDLSNQRSYETWNALNEAAQQFAAAQEQERQIANQQAQLEASGMVLEYSGLMSQLETERALANQTSSNAYQEMQMNYNLSLKELDLQAQISEAEIGLGYYQADTNRYLGDQDYNASMQGLAAQYGYNANAAGGGAASTANSAAVWQEATGDIYSMLSEAGNSGMSASALTQTIQNLYPDLDWSSTTGRQLTDIIRSYGGYSAGAGYKVGGSGGGGN